MCSCNWAYWICGGLNCDMCLDRCGLRTEGQSVGSNNRATADPRSVPRKRSPPLPARARGQRAAATSLPQLSPVTTHLPHPHRPQAPTPPLSVEWVTWAALPQEQRPPPPSGVPLRSRRYRLRPRSPTSRRRPALHACRGRSQAVVVPQECRPIPCPTTRLRATPRDTRPPTLPLTLEAWTAAPIWHPWQDTPTTITRTPITHSWAPWPAPPRCRATTRTTSGTAPGTRTTLTRATAARGCPSAPQTVWITKITKNKLPWRRHGNWTSARRRQIAWTTKTRRPGDFRSCENFAI